VFHIFLKLVVETSLRQIFSELLSRCGGGGGDHTHPHVKCPTFSTGFHLNLNVSISSYISVRSDLWRRFVATALQMWDVHKSRSSFVQHLHTSVTHMYARTHLHKAESRVTFRFGWSVLRRNIPECGTAWLCPVQSPSQNPPSHVSYWTGTISSRREMQWCKHCRGQCRCRYAPCYTSLLQSTPLLLKYLPFREGYMSKLGTDGRIRCRVTID
jgi:hypothetical protein